jgi:hypothetical protein
MTTIYKELVAGATLGAAAAGYYSAPANTAAAIHACSIYNPTAAPVLVTIYRVPSGGSAASAQVIATRTVPAGVSVTAHDAINHKLESGSQIFAVGLGCCLNVSGVEYVRD